MLFSLGFKDIQSKSSLLLKIFLSMLKELWASNGV